MSQPSIPFWVSRNVFLFFLLLGAPNRCAFGTAGSRSYRSPDGSLVANVVAANKSHESRVEIRQKDGTLLAAEDYSSPDGEHGRAVCHAGWTPDSQFFVFSAQNTGGHAPWARPTFFYSRKLNKVIGLDKLIGAVTECAFVVGAPDWLETKTIKPGGALKGVAVKVSLRDLEK